MDYIANHPDHGNSLEYGDEETLEGANKNLIWAYENTGDNNIFGKKLGIKVKIQTLLSGYRATEGNFGLQILISGTKEDADHEATKDVKEIVYFTNDNMYGNPYNYLLPTEQQLILDISSYKAIDSIYIAFWQRFTQSSEKQYVGSFKDIYGDLIPYIDDNLAATGLAEVPANIKLSDLEVYVGMGIDEIENDELFIYTYDNLKYAAGDLKKTLHLSWAQYDKAAKTATVVDATDELYEYDAKIYWYIHDSTWTPETPEYDSGVASHRFGGLFWRPMPLYEDEMTITLEMDVNKSNTRLKAVVHHDGTYLSSDVVRFNNKVDVEGLAEDLARNDQFILRCATYAVDPDLGEKTLYVDDAIGNFYVYDENNNILANDDNELYSDVTYYLEIWAKTHTEDGAETYVRLSDYSDDNGWYEPYSVEWQFPERETMISQFNFINRGEAYYPMRSDEQFERDFASTRSFRVSRTYNMRYADNTIIAVIQRAGQAITIKKTLYFGRAAALGCEYTPVIAIDSPEGNYYIDTNSTYEISCTVYDRRGQVIEAGMRPECSFEWKFYGTSNKPTYYYTENKNGFVGNVIKGRLFVCEPFVVEVTVSGAADYPLTVRRGVMVCNDSRFIQEHDIQCPDRIEFRSDGQSPKYFKNPFTVTTVGLDEKDKYLYPDWYINNEKILKLLEQPVENQTYIAQSGNSVTGGAHTEYAIGFAGPKVFGAALGDDIYAQQWTDNLLSDEYFTYIYFTYGTATVAQAIAFDKNTYASSLVNEWDGQSLSLDEENGAVIAKMIAAGTKDKKNRFTGVMMGDWSEKGDESLDVTGLYGFQAGSQTFAFKQNGTGFIGPSGKGRIHFDGRNALISNSDKSCYLNLNPVMVKKYLDEAGNFTEDEIWDLKNESGYSQYFLYCQVPKKENTEDAWAVADFNEETGEYIDKTWAKSFIDPDENSEQAKYDFFLVDPNNGVVTSGGIYARYGVIGKKYPWIISDSGLTQKNNFGIIYLGNPEVNPLKWNYQINGTDIDGAWKEDIGFTIAGSHNSFPNRATFGITADGQLYSRKGVIGYRYPWHIGDNGLYSEIRGNAVYLGNPQTDYSYHKLSDIYKDTRWKETSYNGFIISAGGTSIRDEETGTMIQKSAAVFGVRPDGFLYSESGLIAGWAIEPGSLTRYKDDGDTEYLIKLDSDAAQIAMVSDDSGKNPMILLDALNKVIKLGDLGDTSTITLAGYQIIGNTEKAAISATISSENAASGDTSKTIAVSYQGINEDGKDEGTATIKNVYLSAAATENPLMPQLTLNLETPNYFSIYDNDDTGLIIYTQNKKLLLHGNGSSRYLGTPDGRWNIFSSHIEADNLHVAENFVGKDVYIYDSFANVDNANTVSGYFKASSRAYVNYRAREIIALIETTNQQTRNYFSTAMNRINQIWKALGSSTDENGTVSTHDQIARLQSAVVSISDATFQGSDGSMSADVKYTSIGGGGSSFKLNFNIADTDYFKSYALHSYSVGGNSDGAGVATSVPTSNSKQVGTTLVILNKKEESMVDKTIIVDATSAYEAGWADAIATLKISVDTGSKTVTATVGDATTGSNTASKTYSLGAGGTLHSGTWHSGITAIAPGVWNSTGEISNPYTGIYGTISWG